MGVEIERKFLVKSSAWKKNARYSRYRQGYIFSEKKGILRVRIVNDKGYLTIKSAPVGLKRQEYEYEIPLNDASEMLNSLCENYIIEKRRYKVAYGDHLWEIDEFEGLNEGLLLAEIELKDEAESFQKPFWVGKEVTNDRRYHNSYLSKSPYTHW